jgi:hypothetical protein
MESIKVPIDREYPDEETVRVSLDSHHFFKDVASLESEKMPKRGTQGSR